MYHVCLVFFRSTGSHIISVFSGGFFGAFVCIVLEHVFPEYKSVSSLLVFVETRVLILEACTVLSSFQATSLYRLKMGESEM